MARYNFRGRNVQTQVDIDEEEEENDTRNENKFRLFSDTPASDVVWGYININGIEYKCQGYKYTWRKNNARRRLPCWIGFINLPHYTD